MADPEPADPDEPEADADAPEGEVAEGAASADDGEAVEGEATAPPSCCAMRRKVIVGILAVLPEAQCGVADAELADFLRFDLDAPTGKPVLAFRFCPWCGERRGPGTEHRIVDIQVVGGEVSDDDDDDDFTPPREASDDDPGFDPPAPFGMAD